MRIQPFQALKPDFSRIALPEAFCDRIKHDFDLHRRNGLFERLERESLFAYQIEAHQRKHIGLIVSNALSDFFSGKIKKHENTLSEREQQQMELFAQWRSVLKPVLLTYPPVEAISNQLKAITTQGEPIIVAKMESSRQTHKIWAIDSAEDIERLQALFEAHVRCAYIADGHHRTTAMARLNAQERDPSNDHNGRLFSAYFASDQLDILDYNRVVEALTQITPTRFMADLSKYFDIQPLDAPRRPLQKHEMVMGIRKEWFSLRWRTELLAQLAGEAPLLDATLLNEYILSGIVGITDVRTDTRITYVDGIKGIAGIKKAMKPSKDRVGFWLHPVSPADMMALADLGQTLPPKSTWFEPRIKSGILIHPLD
ncbi:MAG: DUF1015 family protein [Saprospiraceae bacterium]